MANERDPNEVAYPDPIGARIRERRLELGLSFSELAKRAGLRAPSYLHYIEKGLKIPSEDIARRIARALDDDEDLYVAWTQVRQRGDVATTMGASAFLQRTLGASEDQLLRGESQSHRKELASRDLRFKMLMDKFTHTVRALTARQAPTHELPGPSVMLKVPVLPEGSDPELRPEPLEVLRLDPRLLAMDEPLVRPFAYRLSADGAARSPKTLRAGDLAILTQVAWPIQPGELYALRIDARVVLSRARWSEGTLWALPDKDDEPAAGLGSDTPPEALVGRVAVVVRATGVRGG